MAKAAFNVSELNNYIKKLISMDYILRDINITGEVTNLNVHSNGNIYFSLKDKFARIDAMAMPVLITMAVAISPYLGNFFLKLIP